MCSAGCHRPLWLLSLFVSKRSVEGCLAKLGHHALVILSDTIPKDSLVVACRRWPALPYQGRLKSAAWRVASRDSRHPCFASASLSPCAAGCQRETRPPCSLMPQHH
ncbi:hypothetical protein V8C43DRAFT_294403, partial [Trichoderma afarasin]